MNLVDAITAAIGRQEGYGASAANRPTRNNNPGNIRERPAGDARGPLYPQYPHDAAGYVIFPSAEVGWSELRAKVAAAVASGTTLSAFLSRWAPPSENDTVLYISRVSGWVGIDPARPMSEYAAAAAVATASVPAPAPAWPFGQESSAVLDYINRMLPGSSSAEVGWPIWAAAGAGVLALGVFLAR